MFFHAPFTKIPLHVPAAVAIMDARVSSKAQGARVTLRDHHNA
jgi:hypothetical protein